MNTLTHSIIALCFLGWASIVTAQSAPGGAGGGTGGPRPTGGTGASGGGTTSPAPKPTTPSTGGGRITVPYSRGQYGGKIRYVRVSLDGRRLAVPTTTSRVARINLRGGGRISITTGGGSGGGTVGIGGGPGPTPPQSPGGGGPIAVGIPAPGPRR